MTLVLATFLTFCLSFKRPCPVIRSLSHVFNFFVWNFVGGWAHLGVNIAGRVSQSWGMVRNPKLFPLDWPSGCMELVGSGALGRNSSGGVEGRNESRAGFLFSGGAGWMEASGGRGRERTNLNRMREGVQAEVLDRWHGKDWHGTEERRSCEETRVRAADEH